MIKKNQKLLPGGGAALTARLPHTADLAWRLWGEVCRSSLKTPAGP